MKSYSGRGQKLLDTIIYDRYFINKRNGVCIECGALDGLNLSVCKMFEESLSWKCINVEANPISFDLLTSNRPESTNLNYALSNTNETLLIQCSNKKKLSRIVDESNKNTVEIEAITYRNLIKKLAVDELDLFILDVEGHEQKVLEGMTNCDVLPSVFCIEAHNDDHLKQIKDKLDELKSKYRLDFHSHYNYIFVKE